MKTVSILIIASQNEHRREIRWWLKQTKGITLRGEISEANGLRLVSRLAPDIVVYDCASPTLNPMVVLPALRAQPCAPEILALLSGAWREEEGLMLAMGATACAALHSPEIDCRLATLVRSAGEVVHELREPSWADLLG